MKITNFTHRIITLLLLLSVFSCRKEEIIVQSLFDLSGAPLEYDDNHAERHLNIVAVSMICSKDKSENMKTIRHKAREAKLLFPDTELVLFGESVLV